MSLLNKLLNVTVGEGKRRVGATESVVRSALHGLGHAAAAVDPRLNDLGNKAMDLGLSATKSLVKKTNADFYNGYTGLKPSAFANTLAVAGAAGYMGYSSLKTNAERVTGPVEYEGQAPIMTADGMGTSSAPSLGANGSLVFGLNAMRKGR